MKTGKTTVEKMQPETLEQAVRAGLITPGMNFDQRVWAMTSRIPRGLVTTYGEIAKALCSRAYRAVGSALNRNPYAPGVPCHRVVGSDGRLTGYAGGLAKKRRMLMDEGVTVTGDRVDLTHLHRLSGKSAGRSSAR